VKKKIKSPICIVFITQPIYIANTEWTNVFPFHKVLRLPFGSSDISLFLLTPSIMHQMPLIVEAGGKSFDSNNGGQDITNALKLLSIVCLVLDVMESNLGWMKNTATLRRR